MADACSPSLGAEGATVLLTGGKGFVGARLAAALRRRRPDWRVVACGGPQDGGDGCAVDVTDGDATERIITEHRPAAVVHLAAVSAVTSSIRDPRYAWQVNLWGTLNLVEALQRRAPECLLLFVSSAEVYGRSLQGGTPVDETALLEPLNPYAASKASADILVRQCAATGLRAIVARPFNHTGAGQSEAFVAPAFAGQIARIEAGLQPPRLTVGSLDDERDFLDVEDVVDAYTALLEAGARVPGGAVYNVASGKAMRVGDLLEELLGRSSVPIEVVVDPARLRPGGVSVVVGDASRLRRDVGWAPVRPFADTLAAVLEERRRAIRPL